MSEIMPRLYLTNFRGAEDAAGLSKIGCTHIASVGEEFVADAGLKQITYWTCDISDDEYQGAAMAKQLRTAADFVKTGLASKRNKGCCVVHCAAGVSRSATVVLGYLVLHKKMSLRDAFSLVYAKRPCVWPNDAFMAALIDLDAQQTARKKQKQPSFTIDEYKHWGDYEGDVETPRQPAAASAAPTTAAATAAEPPPRRMPPPPFGRLKRAETNVEQELYELRVLDALAKGREKAALKVQRAWRQLKRYEHEPPPFMSKGMKRATLSPTDRLFRSKEASREAGDKMHVSMGRLHLESLGEDGGDVAAARSPAPVRLVRHASMKVGRTWKVTVTSLRALVRMRRAQRQVSPLYHPPAPA